MEYQRQALFDTNAPPNSTLRAEGDVIRLSNSLLVYPVEQALNMLTDLELRTQSEVSGNGTRVDLTWQFCWSGTRGTANECWVTFAVLEYKRPNVIKKEDFCPSKEGIAKKRGKVLDHSDLIAEARKPNPMDWLIMNSRSLLRQANKYGQDCKFIALFDYDTLALFDYSSAEVDGRNFHRWAEAVFYEKDTCTPQQLNQGYSNRTLLLSFVYHALRYRCAGLDQYYQAQGQQLNLVAAVSPL